MAEAESHPIRTGVITTVVGGIATAVLTELWPPAKQVLASLWSQLTAFGSLFIESYRVPGWALVVLVGLVLPTLARCWALFAKGQVPLPREDQLSGAKWRWSWSYGEISSLWCFCPHCDSELVYDDSESRDIFSMDGPRTRFICERCNRQVIATIAGGDKEYALGAIRREIRRKLRLGLYANANQSAG